MIDPMVPDDSFYQAEHTLGHDPNEDRHQEADHRVETAELNDTAALSEELRDLDQDDAFGRDDGADLEDSTSATERHEQEHHQLGVDAVRHNHHYEFEGEHDAHFEHAEHDEKHSSVVGQAYVQAEGGKASAFVSHVEGLDSSGTLSVVGVKHQLGNAQTGDYVHVWIGQEHIHARITDISAEHDRYRAEIPSELAHAVLENTGQEALFKEEVHIGDGAQFVQLAGVPGAVLREGTIAGVADPNGEVLMLSGTECGPGASGSPVFDTNGQLVGQVLAYDPQQHLTLIASTDQILADLQDFAEGRNLEDHASPVSYKGLNTVCDVNQ